ncbi:helix-turn-helix domain-containing protein [Spirosoma liriopis]
MTKPFALLLLVSHKPMPCFLPARFRLALCMDNMPPMIHHGRNVKRIREILGVKQDYLATSLGLSQQAVSQLEQKEVLDAPVLQKLSKALGVTEEAIRNFTEEAAVNVVANTINNHDQSAVVNYYPTFNPIDKIVELYERILVLEREKAELQQKLFNIKEQADFSEGSTSD